MVSCSGIVSSKIPIAVPIIIFGGFCNWLELCEVLGFDNKSFSSLMSLPIIFTIFYDYEKKGRYKK